MERISKAIYLIDDNEHPFPGWVFDNRGLEMSQRGMNAKFNFEKVHPEFDTLLKRHFRKQTDSVVTLEANFAINCPDGFALKLYDEQMNVALGVITRDGEFVLTCGHKTSIRPEPSAGVGKSKNSFKAVINLPEKYYEVILNNTLIGSFALPEEIKDLKNISIGIEKGYTGKLYAHGIKMYADYAVNERFLTPFKDVTPCDWEVICESAVCGSKSSLDNTFSKEDIYYYEMKTDNGNASLTKEITPLYGDRCYEIKFIESEGTLRTSFVLAGSEKTLSITAEDGILYLMSGDKTERICEYPHNLWNTLRAEIIADKITVKLNGKIKGTYEVEIPHCTDTVAVVTAGTSTLGIDDILLFPLEALPADYVPVPKPAKTKGYHVGLHVFSSWRYGFWRGTHDATWDVCSAFDEVTPYMGYYDEGIPEVADWESKWFCEHGIDFQLQCWYGPAVISEPIKFPGFSHALHDGYFNSRYKNYSKFAIMWENNFTNKISCEAFEKYLVPYFIEYYFKDPCYYCIDNKPVFSIYSIGTLAKPEYFGSVEQARKEMDFMRNAVKEAGFDDMIFLCAGGSGGKLGVEYREALGVEGSYAYNWGTSSYTAEYQVNMLTGAANAVKEYAKNGSVHVPTVGVGFNCVSRHDKRHPSISIPEYEKILTWTRDVFLTDTEQFPDQNSWQSKMVLLSCWNEFDEGHYINPSGLHGFGFLDTLRKVFTEEEPNNNIKPTENQKKRICILYPEGHAWLRPERRLPPKQPSPDSKVIASWDFSDKAVCDKWLYQVDAQNKEQRNGALYGTSESIDPQVVFDGEVNIPTADVEFVRITMRTMNSKGIPSTTNVQIFYTTSTHPALSGSLCLTGSANASVNGEFATICIPTLGANGWSGDLKVVRIDPISGSGAWEISKLEFIYSGDVQSIEVDGTPIMMEIPIEEKNGVPFVAMYSKSNLMNRMNATYLWNRAKKLFTLIIGENRMEFAEGSSVCMCGGKMYDLPDSVFLADGVPAIPLEFVCKICGYGYSYDGKLLSITTA